MSKYLNPYTDFGFKKLFGSELNKDLLISFLNALFEQSKGIVNDEITDITYLNAEKLGRSASERRAIFDVYCTTKNGNRFIVEMQNVFQQFFKDRSVYYSSFPIREMAKKDTKDETWNYELQSVYTVGILNFVFKDEKKEEDTGKLKIVNEFSDDDLFHIVVLTDQTTGKIFYDKLVYFYLEMPKFQKKEDELVTMYDKWLFVLRNLSKLLERPRELQERIFERVFKEAEIAMFTPEEYTAYEESLHSLWDITNAMNDAESKGFNKGKKEGEKLGIEKGREQGRVEGEKLGIEKTAIAMLKKGLPVELIAEISQLSVEEIEELKKTL